MSENRRESIELASQGEYHLFVLLFTLFQEVSYSFRNSGHALCICAKVPYLISLKIIDACNFHFGVINLISN